jgi:diguanylate cyclase (GGDEF)-like protein/PAS domain S-box-containing protein
LEEAKMDSHDSTAMAPGHENAAGITERASVEIARLRGELAASLAREAELSVRCRQNDVYRAIVQSLPNGAVFAFDRDLRFLIAEGPELFDGVGLRREEIQGRTLAQVTPEENLAQLEPLYRETLAGRSQRMLVRRGQRVFDVHTAPLTDASGAIVGGVVTSYDVTGRHDEAERLRTVTAQLAILLDHLSTGVVFSDRQGNVQIVNRAMGMLLGMSNPAELVGTHAADSRQAERFDDPEGVTLLLRERSLLRTPVIGDQLRLRNGRILERDYLPLEMRGGFGGDLWCFRDVTDRERARVQLADQADALRELSMQDELTRLNNRRGFMILGEQQIKMAHRARRPVAVFFVDLNGMKAINDRLGHEEGDRALLDAAHLLRQTFRDSDVIARLGGDEFVVLATDCPSGNVPTVKTRLLAAIELFNADVRRRYQLSMSIGVATYDPTGAFPRTRTIEELLVEADERMYEEKVETYRGSTSPRSSVLCQRPSARISSPADLRRSSLPPSARAASQR